MSVPVDAASGSYRRRPQEPGTTGRSRSPHAGGRSRLRVQRSVCCRRTRLPTRPSTAVPRAPPPVLTAIEEDVVLRGLCGRFEGLGLRGGLGQGVPRLPSPRDLPTVVAVQPPRELTRIVLSHIRAEFHRTPLPMPTAPCRGRRWYRVLETTTAYLARTLWPRHAGLLSTPIPRRARECLRAARLVERLA